MTAQIIDGRIIANRFNEQSHAAIAEGLKAGLPQPGLAVVLVGHDPASEVYVRNKRERCQQVGIASFFHALPADTSEAALLDLIARLNADARVHGILVQLPLPAHIQADKIIEAIVPHKDVDGFHPYNLGRLAQKRPTLRPCTPYGVMRLLQSIQLPLTETDAVVIGASNIVGRPMALELVLAGATVSICHRRTRDIAHYIRAADLVVSAVGHPGLIQGEWIKPGATVIDIGITRLADGSLTGDVDFAAAATRAAWITPVPGGVGPMTVAMLIRNTMQAAGYNVENLK